MKADAMDAMANPDEHEHTPLTYDDTTPANPKADPSPPAALVKEDWHAQFGEIGSAFYWIVVVNMVVKGLQDTLPALATLYFFKDDLDIGPVGATSAIAIVNLPWTLKPLYGFMSDNYPVLGMRRKPYIISSMALMCVMWLAMALVVHDEYSAIICLILANFGCAVANVCCEAITVEMSCNLNYKQAATLQSLMWGACAAGAFVGSAFGGFGLSVIGKRAMFGIMSAIPALSIVLTSLGPKEAPMSDEAKLTTESFAAFAHKIASVLSRRHVWRSCLFLFIFFAVPSTSAAAYFYFTNHLHMGESVMAVVMTAAMGTWLLGVVFYNTCLRAVTVRKVLGWGTLLAAVVTLFAILLYTRANKKIGIPDEAFVVTDTSMVSAVKTVAQLPLMTMMAMLCPKGAEATLYSTFTGIMNLGQVTGGEAGALLSLIFNITSHKFDNMWAVCLTAGLIQLLPLCFLWLLPTPATLAACEAENHSQEDPNEAKHKLNL